MSNNMQKTKHATAEKMQRVYGTEVEHKHNKDHLEFEDKQQSHPHQKHGGKNEGHKHLINHHTLFIRLNICKALIVIYLLFNRCQHAEDNSKQDQQACHPFKEYRCVA